MKKVSLLLLLSWIAVYAQEAQGPCDKDLVIETLDDASILSSCQTYNGNVAINFLNVNSFTLNDVKVIKGGLQIAHNPSLLQFFAPSLEQVGGDISIFDNTAIDSIEFTQLTNIGSLYVTGSDSQMLKSLQLPSLQQAERNISIWRVQAFNLQNVSEVKNAMEINECSIQNVELNSLKSVGSLTLRENPELLTVTLTKLEQINGALLMKDNNQWIGFSQNQTSSLKSVTGTIIIQQSNGSSIKEIKFGNNLQTIQGSLFISLGSGNSDLCQNLQGQMLSSNKIVKGSFKCSVNGQDLESGSNLVIANMAICLLLSLLIILTF